jgi:methionyl aminopeptidase
MVFFAKSTGHLTRQALGDGWTAIPKDRKPSAQWEHTILVTDNGYETLTLRDKKKPLTDKQ